MTTDQNNRPLLARILSLEGAMAAFGIYSLGTGVYYGESLWIFWGVMILAGLGLLVLVRRRDWKKHWEEIDAAAERSRRSSKASPDTSTEEK